MTAEIVPESLPWLHPCPHFLACRFSPASSCATCSIRSVSLATPTTCTVPASAGTTSCSRRRSLSEAAVSAITSTPTEFLRSTPISTSNRPGCTTPRWRSASGRSRSSTLGCARRGRTTGGASCTSPTGSSSIRRRTAAGTCISTCRSTGFARHGRAPLPRAGACRYWRGPGSAPRTSGMSTRPVARSRRSRYRSRKAASWIRTTGGLRTRNTRRSRPRTSSTE